MYLSLGAHEVFPSSRHNIRSGHVFSPQVAAFIFLAGLRIRIHLFIFFIADPDPNFTSIGFGICEHWSSDPPELHFDPQRLHCEHPRPFTLKPLKLLFLLQCGSANADPDPASQNNSDPDPQLCLLDPVPTIQ
jgi:hypothetical protein